MTNEAAVPFLSNTPARPWDRRIAGAVVVLALLGFALAAPFAKTLWPAIPAFIPAYEAALVLNDLITAILLFTQFRQLRTPSLLASCAGRCARSAVRVSSTGAPASASMKASRSGG